MSIYTDEIFGPVLSVLRLPSYGAAVELVNANRYGNGTAIFTNDGGAARRFQNEVEHRPESTAPGDGHLAGIGRPAARARSRHDSAASGGALP